MRELIEKIIEAKLKLSIDRAKVLSVADGHCKVQSLTNGKTYFKCALNAIQQNQGNELKVTPATDSEVCIGILPDGSSFVVSVSKASKIHYKQETTEFTVDANGYKIERQGENLFDCIKDMIGEVKKIVVIYGNGPDIPALTEIETRTNKILI